MWIPRRIELFLESVIERLGAIENAIYEQGPTDRDGDQSDKVKRSEIPGIISASINANEESETARTERTRITTSEGIVRQLGIQASN